MTDREINNLIAEAKNGISKSIFIDQNSNKEIAEIIKHIMKTSIDKGTAALVVLELGFYNARQDIIALPANENVTIRRFKEVRRMAKRNPKKAIYKVIYC